MVLAGKNNEREVIKFTEQSIQMKDTMMPWEYYDVLKRQFGRKPDKKAKYRF